jgi:hypothetical protein
MSDRGAALLVALGLGAGALACGHPEKTVVDQYFNAVRTKDNQTLASFAAVRFEKPVQSWAIKDTLEENTEPLPLTTLAQRLRDAETALAANKKAASAYSLDNYTDIEQVRDLKSKGRPIPAKLSQTASRWEEFNAKDRAGKKAVAEAKEALEREKRSMSLSLGADQPMDGLQGEVKTKKIVVEVTTPEGQTQPYVMTLKKYEVKREKGPRTSSRWMVQALHPRA